MSCDAIIRVENLSKRYQLSHLEPRREGLRHRLENFARSPLRWLKTALNQSPQGNVVANGAVKLPKPGKEEFWALKDVTFDVKQGEVVGVIGRNGAGKSTLLKILSRITEPTTGRVTIEGRVASLLEVGTGFHPELTGRENIFLNGAILGMSKVEIKKKFDEIVAFAEIEKFLDTPVKRYSSGMYVRLAFAVAAHLEPEIFVVDEVLAVGDSEFQRKCLGKMENVANQQGRTVLFVSHNLDALKRVCQKGLLLVAGRVKELGPIDAVLARYMQLDAMPKPRATMGNRASFVQQVRVSQNDLAKGRLRLEIDFSSPFEIEKPTFGIVVHTAQGTPVFGSNTLFQPFDEEIPPSACGTATIVVDPLPLWSGQYRVSVWLTDATDPLDHCPDAVTFDFLSPGTPANVPSIQIIGSTRVKCRWIFSPSLIMA